MTQSFSRRSCGADFRESDRAGRYRGAPSRVDDLLNATEPAGAEWDPLRIDERVELELERMNRCASSTSLS
jgi:hypothetical protein